MKRAIPVVVLLAVAAGAAALLWKRDTPKPLVTDEGGEAGGESPAPRPSELAAGPASARRDRGPGAPSTGAARLSGTVRHGGAPTPARVEAHWISAIDANPFARRRSGYLERLLAAPASEGEATATARAGEDGRYAIDGLPPGLYELRATADDGARGATLASVAADGARVEANVEVEGGAESLSGRVVRTDGSPWSGLVVVESWNGAMRGGVLGVAGGGVSTRADAQGAFEAKGLRAGEVTVTAIEPGAFRVTSTGVRVPATAPFVLTIDLGLAPFKGRVVADADGAPIAGASVAGGGQGGAFSLFVAQTTSGADGTFELRLPAGPQAGVVVTADGYAPAMWQARGAKEGEPIEIRLAKTARITGRVARTGGEPVAGASVRALPLGDRNFFGATEGATTGVDGRYELGDVAPGDVMVVAEAKGLVTKGIADLDANRQGYNPLATPVKSGETAVVDVELVPGARATGTVTDATGAPVRGALVWASGGPVSLAGLRLDGSSGATAVSGPDGTFAVDPLVPGKAYTFLADCAGFARCKSDVVTVTEAAPAVVALRFAAVRTAEVSVLDDASGKGVVGARVTAQGDAGRRGGVANSGASWVTSADGRVTIGPLEPGDLRIDVVADDYVRGAGDRNSTLAEGASAIVVRMTKGLPIAGKVLLPDASPAVGASVQVEWDGREGRGWVSPSATGADGTFRLRGVAPGTVKLRAELTRDGKAYAGRATVTVGAEDVSISLVEGAASEPGSGGGSSLVVRVLDPDGKPVPRASARWTSDGSSNGTNVVDGRVTFGVERRKGGKVEVWGAKSSTGTPLHLAPAARDVGPDEKEIELRLAPGVSITGTVRGPDGAGLRGVVVSAGPVSRDAERGYYGGDWESRGSVRTDTAGAFRLDGLAAEDYALSVQAPAEFERWDGPPVRGGTTGVEVVLKTGLSAVVTVVDDAGKPVAGASVNVSETPAAEAGAPRRTSRNSAASTDAAGVARVGGLSSRGVFSLQVSASDALPWTQTPWAPADTIVHLERAYTLSGVTQDRAGRPVARANVQWSKDRSSWNGTQSGTDGRFRVQGVPSGEVYVRAQIGWTAPRAPGEADDAEKDTLRVRAGAKDLVLVVDVGLSLTVRFENWPADAPAWQRPQLAIEGAAARAFDGSPSDSVSPDGVVTYRGLREDETYRLAVSLPGGLCCAARGLKAGGEVRVRLAPGKSITGRLTLAPGAENAQVGVDGVSARARVEADGRYTIEGIPEGTYEVTAFFQKDGEWWMASGKATAGGTLDLEPKKR